MPLLRRSPPDYAPLPEVAAPAAPVFYIGYTGELFLDYEEYITRVTLYRRKIWSCEFTGKINLSYTDALESERRSRQKLGERFPRVWNLPALQRIHFNQLSLNELIDYLHDFFRSTHFVGEVVLIDFMSPTNSDKIIEKATIIEQLPEPTNETEAAKMHALEPPTEIELGSGPDRSARTLIFKPLQRRDPNLSSEIDQPVQDDDIGSDKTTDKHYYRVHLVGPDAKEMVLPGARLRRDRQSLSKQTIKKYIRDVASKKKYLGAPWHVKPELVKKYNLPTTPPEEVRLFLERRNEKFEKPEVKKKILKAQKLTKDSKELRDLREIQEARDSPVPSIKDETNLPVSFPIEDLDLYQPRFAKMPIEGKPLVLSPPERCYDFGDIPASHVSRLIMVWNFATIYSPILCVYPFTFDEFLQAISIKDADKPAALLEELFGSMVAIACNEWVNGMDPATNVHPAQQVLHDITKTISPVDEKMPDAHESAVDVKINVARTRSSRSSAGGTEPDKASPVKSESGMQLLGESESPSPISKHMYINVTLAAYDSLDGDERVAIDQWFRWQPGQWLRGKGTSSKRSRASSRQASANAPPPPATDEEYALKASARLKAWEVALAGLVKDWVPSTDILSIGTIDRHADDSVSDRDDAFKWRVLSTLLTGKLPTSMSSTRYSNGKKESDVKPKADKNDDPMQLDHVEVNDVAVTEPVDDNEDDTVDEDGLDDHEDDDGDGNEEKPGNDSIDVDDEGGENDDDDDDDESFAQSNTGIRKRRKISDSDDGDWTPGDGLGSTRGVRSKSQRASSASEPAYSSGRTLSGRATTARTKAVAAAATTSRSRTNTASRSSAAGQGRSSARNSTASDVLTDGEDAPTRSSNAGYKTVSASSTKASDNAKSSGLKRGGKASDSSSSRSRNGKDVHSRSGRGGRSSKRDSVSPTQAADAIDVDDDTDTQPHNTTQNMYASTTSIGGMSFESLCTAARSGFCRLSPADRIALLAFLIEECLVECEVFRQCRDQNIDLAIELRKQRRELVRERKQVTQKTQELDPSAPLASSSAAAAGGGGDGSSSAADVEASSDVGTNKGGDDDDDTVSEQGDSDMDGSNAGAASKTATTYHGMSRVQKLRMEQQRREMEERRRREEAQRQKEISKEMRARVDERRRLEERNRELERAEHVIDHSLRMHYAAVRIRPLGRDRFHNRYWWFDGGFGAYPFSTVMDLSGRKLMRGKGVLAVATAAAAAINAATAAMTSSTSTSLLQQTGQDHDVSATGSQSGASAFPSLGVLDPGIEPTLLPENTTSLVEVQQGDPGLLDWSSGALFVEEFGVGPPCLVAGETGGVGTDATTTVDTPASSSAAATATPLPDVKPAQDTESSPSLHTRLGLIGGRWGYYTTPDQITQLLLWLDSRGVRELNLLANIETVREFMIKGMDQRVNVGGQRDVGGVGVGRVVVPRTYFNHWAPSD